MTWDPNTPLPSDKIRNFPGDITTNQWPVIQTIVSADHQFNLTPVLNDNSGYHKVIHFVTEGATPAAVAGSGELYTLTKDTTETLYFQEGGGREIQITGPATTAGTHPYMTLPGGYILQGGADNVATGTTTTISFGITYGAVYSVVLTGVTAGDPNKNVFVQSVGLGSFVVNNRSSTITSVNWIAFGLQA